MTMACRLVPTSKPTPQVLTQIPPEEPATSTPLPDTPVPTAIPNPCPVQQTLPPPEKQALTLYPEAVKAYLAQGGQAEDIPLVDWEAYLNIDLTGDLIPEYVFIFVDPASEFYPPLSVMVIYQCSRGTVDILQLHRPEEWMGLQIIGAVDLTQDNQIDFSFADVNCGAHTCWHTLHVWSWSGTEFTDTAGADLSFPFPEYLLEKEQLLITSAGIGSVGAGPQRLTHTTIAWNGAVVTATHTTVDPAVYRYHAFIDGDTALYAGDYDIATRHYNQVIQEPDLSAWGALYSADEEMQWLTALAHWRLLNLSVIQNSLDAATQHFTALRDNYPPGSAGYPIVIISEQFWQKITAGENLQQACNAVQSLPEMLPIIDFINSFGYANPFYEVNQLCFSPSN